MLITDIVNVTITIQDRVPATSNFGVPLLLGHVPGTVDPAVFGVKSYPADLAGLASLVTDGIPTTSWIYGAASVICAQSPHCATFAIGARRVTTGLRNSITVAGTWVSGNACSAEVFLDGVSLGVCNAVVDADPTPVEIALSLQGLIHAKTGVSATVVSGATTLYVSPDSPESRISITVAKTSTSGTVATAEAPILQKLTLACATTPTIGARYSFGLSIGLGTVTTIAHTTTAGQVAADVLDALYTLAVAAGATVAKVGAPTTALEITSATAATRVYLNAYTANLTVTDGSVDAGVTTDLTAAAVAGVDFYGVLVDSNSAAEIQAAATWCEANNKLLGTLSLDSGNYAPASTADVAYLLNAAARNNCYLFATRDSKGLGEAALMGRQFALNPGASTWALKGLSGPLPDAWSATESGALHTKKAVTYSTVRGLNLTSDGWAPSGRFLDITHGNAWLKDQLETAIVTTVANQEKVDNDDIGRGLVKGALGGVMANAQARKLISGGWVVTVPTYADVTNTPANRIARLLEGITITCTLLGALHKYTISVTESV
jgi:hypothetical protein